MRTEKFAPYSKIVGGTQIMGEADKIFIGSGTTIYGGKNKHTILSAPGDIVLEGPVYFVAQPGQVISFIANNIIGPEVNFKNAQLNFTGRLEASSFEDCKIRLNKKHSNLPPLIFANTMNCGSLEAEKAEAVIDHIKNARVHVIKLDGLSIEGGNVDIWELRSEKIFGNSIVISHNITANNVSESNVIASESATIDNIGSGAEVNSPLVKAGTIAGGLVKGVEIVAGDVGKEAKINAKKLLEAETLGGGATVNSPHLKVGSIGRCKIDAGEYGRIEADKIGPGALIQEAKEVYAKEPISAAARIYAENIFINGVKQQPYKGPGRR